MFKKICKITTLAVLTAFLSSSVQLFAFGQTAFENQLPWMPKPGVRVSLSSEFTPAVLKGITIHPDNALMFDFIIYRGDKELSTDEKQAEYKKLIKYFLASLAVPDEDQWVNLSPYENNRIIKDDFGKTEMGRDLLAQDYILKQITASLIYPEDGLGKKFWDKVYAQAHEKFGTTDVPVNTFNKVWIVPDDAMIYEKGNTAYVIKNHLKVMLEEDYLSLEKHTAIIPGRSSKDVNALGSQVVREIVLPALEEEINTAKNFANLRQVYSGMILAAWFKHALKESLLGQIYANKSKLKGIDQDPKNNEVIYHRYLEAYKKGVFNFIKEDVDRYTNEIIPRKYFSGGAEAYMNYSHTVHFASPDIGNSAMVANRKNLDLVTTNMEEQEAVGLLESSSNNTAKMHDEATGIISSVRNQMFSVSAGNEETARAIVVRKISKLRPSLSSTTLKNIADRVRLKPAANKGEYAVTFDAGMKAGENVKEFVEGLGTGKYEIQFNNVTGAEIAGLLGFTDPSFPGFYDALKRRVLANIIGKKEFITKKSVNVQAEALLESGDWAMKGSDDINKFVDGLKSRTYKVYRDISGAEFVGLLNLDQTVIPFYDALRSKIGESATQQEMYEEAEALLKNGSWERIGQVKSVTNVVDQGNLNQAQAVTKKEIPLGGIDFNAANLNLQIKRDGRGVPLPLSQQDMAQISLIQGLDPVILSIKPANQTPLFSQLN